MAGALTAAIAAAFAGSAAPSSDQYFEYTTLLLPGNGTNGAQNNTFLDGSTNNFTITRNGNTTQGTFSPFSQTGWGNYFNGTSGYLTASDSGFVATGDFTVEVFVYGTLTGAYQGIFSTADATDTAGFRLGISNTNFLEFWLNGSSNTSTAYVFNQWNHIAMVRSGSASNNVSCYFNGTRVAQFTNTSSTTNSLVALGRYRTGGTNQYWFGGYLSNARLVTGAALYSGATITVPTSPLSIAPSGTTQLLTCQSNRFVDNSSTPKTITINGTVTVQAFSPFNPTASWSAATYGGSGYFDGNGDYLSTNYTFNWSTYGSYTLEFWVYHTTMAPTNQWYFVGGTGGTGNTLFYNYSNGKVGLGINGTNEIASATGVIKANTWQHVAYTYNGTTTKIYVDGVEVASGTTAVYANSSVAMSVGGGSSSSSTVMNGYMANLRLSQSVIYTTAFTPPTSPVTGGALLLNFTNAGIYDATSKNDLETVGNAQISTTQSKWGGGSIAFDGTGDYLLMPSSQLNAFGTGDFTIEMWFYLNNTSAIQALYDSRPTSTDGAYSFIYVNAGGTAIIYDVSAGTRITGTATVSTSTWHHLAISRSGTSTKMFFNGTQVGSTYTDSTNYLVGTSRPAIGSSGFSLGTYPLNGYIDDLRVSRVARYTANFTAPTAAFPTL